MRGLVSCLILPLVLCSVSIRAAPPAEGAARNPSGSTAGDHLAAIPRLWQQMRRADAGSQELGEARAELTATIKQLPPALRVSAASAMMDRRADDSVNASALELFGPDPLPIADVGGLLQNDRRSQANRLVLKTYFGFCRAEYKTSPLSDQMRRGLVALLAGRLEGLVGKRLHYGEQRLLTHLCAAALSGYAFRDRKVPQARLLLAAMSRYVQAAKKEDGLSAAFGGWLALRRTPETLIRSVDGALAALGHWETLVRWRASASLGEHVEKDNRTAALVWAKLTDPRDEVRAAAARVFGFAHRYRDTKIVSRMSYMLAWDRGVVVQAAAAEVLIARAGEAAKTIEPLLAVFRTRRPGPKRTSSILAVLSQLSDRASDAQKREILALAVKKLSVSPVGALAALKSLGPLAGSAAPAVKAYRATADRFMRLHIDRHVLPAIQAAEGDYWD